MKSNSRQFQSWTWLSVIVLAIVFAASIGRAAGWTKTEGGSTVCTSLFVGDTCFAETNAENTTAIHVGNCSSVSILIHETAVSVVPESCTNSACTTTKALSDALTGTSPNAFVGITIPFAFLRLATTSNATVEIICGG